MTYATAPIAPTRSAATSTPPPMSRTRVAPVRLCLRRRFRACRDIFSARRDYRSKCDFLPFALPRPLRSAGNPMNPDTAEMAIADTASELVVPFEPSAGSGRRRLAAYRRWTRLREDPAHVAAVSDSWRALLASRL